MSTSRVPQLLSVISATVLAACASAPDEYWPDTNWVVHNPDSLGVSSAELQRLSETIRAGEFHRITSLIILRHGKPVFEEFFERDSTALWPVYSVAKSVTAAAVGMAIDDGDFPDVDEAVTDWLPLDSADARWKQVTIEHLLTMRTGLDWDESVISDSDFMALQDQNDPVGFMSRVPFASQPGTDFRYNSGAPILLAAVFRNSVGENLADYTRDRLFAPLGITEFEWVSNGDVTNAGNGLYLHTRDMAKIGHLFLRGGRWRDQQLVPESWMRACLARHTEAGAAYCDYGYLWWVFDLDEILLEYGVIEPVAVLGKIYMARGYRGQAIAVLPQYDLVVAITAALTTDEMECCDPLQVLVQSVLPAIPEFTRALLNAAK